MAQPLQPTDCSLPIGQVLWRQLSTWRDTWACSEPATDFMCDSAVSLVWQLGLTEPTVSFKSYKSVG